MVRTATSQRGYEEYYSSSCSTRATCEAACAAVNGGTTAAVNGATSTCSCLPPTYVQRTCFLAALPVALLYATRLHVYCANCDKLGIRFGTIQKLLNFLSMVRVVPVQSELEQSLSTLEL